MGLLALPVLRAARWQPVPVAIAVAVLLTWWQDDLPPDRQVWLLRGVLVVLAAGLASALDDRARGTVAAVPVPLWRRTALPVALLAAPTAAAWLVLVLVVDRRHAGAVPVLDLSLEAATTATVALALAAVLARRPALPEPGLAVGPVLLSAALGLPALPDRAGLAVPLGPDWSAAHVRWSLLLVAAVLAGLLAVRDPAAYGAKARWSRTRRPSSASPSTSTAASAGATRPPVSRMNVRSDIRSVTSTSSEAPSEASGPSAPTRTVS
jgi:hypothetical protein